MALINAYATVAELGAKMGLDSDKIVLHTPLLEQSLNNASRFIDLKTESFFYESTIFDEIIDAHTCSDSGFYISKNCVDVIAPAPIISISALSEEDVVLSERTSFGGDGDYVIKKIQGVITRSDSAWSQELLAIKLDGTFGYSAVPGEVNELCLTIASVFTRLDNRIVADENGDIESILSSKIPTWVFKSLKRLARPIL